MWVQHVVYPVVVEEDKKDQISRSKQWRAKPVHELQGYAQSPKCF
jgi:hypothetical protein